MKLRNFETEAQWLEWRRTGVGASDAASAIGESTAFRTPYQLWESKINGKEVEDNYAMKTGRDKEGPVRDWLNHLLGQNFQPALYSSDEHPWLLASLDGILESEDLAIEIKNAGKPDHDSAVNGHVPRKYWIQCQHQMMVIPTLNSVLYVSCPIKGNPDESIVLKIDRDDEYIRNELFPKLQEFQEKVTTKTPPALCERDVLDLGENDLFKEFIENTIELRKRKERDDKLREEIKQISGGLSCTAFGVKFMRQEQKGTIDYCQAITDYVCEMKEKHPEINFPPLSYDNYRKSFTQWKAYGI